jgi:hypothetical protein
MMRSWLSLFPDVADLETLVRRLEIASVMSNK